VIINNQQHKSEIEQRGWKLISSSVEKLLRLKKRLIFFCILSEVRGSLKLPLRFRCGIDDFRYASLGMTSSRELANAGVVLGRLVPRTRMQGSAAKLSFARASRECS